MISPDVRELLVPEVPSLLRYARTIARSRESAEDLVQETLLRALQRADTFRGESSLRTWLHRILHNLAVDRLRQDREDATGDVERELEEQWHDDSYTVDAAVVVERAELRDELLDALLRLPVIYRTAVVLHDVEGMTVAGIADVQCIGLPAAKQRLRRGRMMLVSALARGPERRAGTHGVPLRCWDARRRVSDYLDGELTVSDRVLVERHLEGCPTCPPLYAGLVGARDALGSLRDADTVVPAPLAERISEMLART
ncbi:MAG TPA: sigma-70 family RNA polymerase sigma factor [Cellulomonas sp.]|uniref:sigma-70 family RNA polymerase sigma factor n=1 Tax=Cellulomonas sp. TaxID=40001 RepID=UPI002E3055E9|nr:sigma-70 family RNA polymerase sigma factor [Cellulomonas sp.]HEX5333111.1 sigma-70 family RNA polymerase sigma factor [Cellulomonas sp.]